MREWLLTWHRRGLLAVPRQQLGDVGVNSLEPLPAKVVMEPSPPSAESTESAVPVQDVAEQQGHFVENRPPLDVLENLERGRRRGSTLSTPDSTSTLPTLPSDGTRAERLAAFYAAVGECQRCGLCKGRTRIVFGSGNPDSSVMLVGEGPGRNEDMEGLPFVGRSGVLLTRMLSSVGLDRQTDLFITNVVKCRPPNNRDPQPEEVASCRFILEAQIQAIQPRVVVIAGLQAAKALLGPHVTLSGIRQRRQTLGESQVLATYHPSFLLRTPGKKADAWRDMVALRILLAEVALAPPVPKAWWS